MKFSNFLFPESRDPAREGAVLDEIMDEVRLTERLGFDTLWLSEHHFDGNCAYVDPISFAAAVAVATRRVRIGLAVAQMSLHHPVRIAEQLSLIDHLSKGRLLVGLGRGTAYNIYEYQGYGIDHTEAQARFEEAASIMRRAWTSEDGFTHHGRFWNLDVPVLRPRPYTRPHPFTIHAAAGAHSIVELGAKGLPFLMNVQTLDTTRDRIRAWQAAGREHGIPGAAMQDALNESWVWRNVFVADTDAEAERIAVPAFEAMHAHRVAMRNRVEREQGATMVDKTAKPPAHGNAAQALICGSPATVARHMAAIAETGVGGVILQFRMGPMSWKQTARSLELFAQEVAPQVGQHAGRVAELA